MPEEGGGRTPLEPQELLGDHVDLSLGEDVDPHAPVEQIYAVVHALLEDAFPPAHGHRLAHGKEAGVQLVGEADVVGRHTPAHALLLEDVPQLQHPCKGGQVVSASFNL